MNVLVLLLLCISFSLSVGGDLAPGCIERERQALLEFKSSLTSPSNRLSSWFGQGCCTWYGVVCNNITTHVVELNLQWSEIMLHGTEVTHALAERKDLEVLNLGGNNFGGSKIPDFFGSFKSLRELSLADSSFAGVVPHSLANLSNLQHLDLGALEYLRVDSLTWLTHLSDLQYLSFTFVNLSKVRDLPEALNSFPSLSHLSLSFCELVQFPLSLLSPVNFTSLTVLDLVGNRFQGQLPNTIHSLSKLETLHLQENSFGGHIPNWLSELKNLQDLDLSANSFSGSIPTSLGTSSSLRFLKLGSNKLNGTVPPNLGQLSSLVRLVLSNNLLSGSISENHFDKLSKLLYLDLSSNFLFINVSSNWIPPFQLYRLLLGSCQLGSTYPLWLLRQKAITWISIPGSLSGPSRLGDLLPLLPSNIEVIDLSSNLISGPIPFNIGDLMPNLRVLILANNSINGGIPTSLCGMRKFEAIDLSNNNLVGEFPRNCWNGSINMRNIDLASNSLTGNILRGIGHLPNLFSLHLSKNIFYGELPIEMQNCRKLNVLDLADNGFSGKIPLWIEELSSLQILELRSNKFEGSLISELCHIHSLRVLDLAQNKFSGTIPPCFENFDGMKHGQNMEMSRFYGYNEKLEQVIKGRELQYTKTLKYLVNLDLSNNNLVGNIPEGLTSLVGLKGINLSNNGLVGGIPNMIGNLKSLESLDFSKNQLSGMIPQSLSDLGLMGHLNLSFNNLSGQIPSGHPQAFDSSSYTGNPELCGIPLEKKCPKDNSPNVIDVNQNEEHGSFVDGGFYIGMGTGVIVGFWGFCGVLLFKGTWRYTYFRFIENMQDRLLCRIITC